MTEREREALMRLTMCARNECVMCKYKDSCDSDVRFEFATKHMIILADALNADRKTENSSEKPNNCEPQYEMSMGTLRCDNCSEYGSFKCTKCDGEMYFTRLEPKTEPNNYEPKICDFCRYYNSNIPCGSIPSACKEADKFAEEFVDGLKKLKPKDEPQKKEVEWVYNNRERLWYPYSNGELLFKTEPQTCSFGLHMDCSLCWKESHCKAIKEAERKEREGE